MNKISIIIPCYNEEKSLPLFYQELTKHTRKFWNRYTIWIYFCKWWFFWQYFNNHQKSLSNRYTYQISFLFPPFWKRIRHLRWSWKIYWRICNNHGCWFARSTFSSIRNVPIGNQRKLWCSCYTSHHTQRWTNHSQFFCQTIL